MRPGNTVTTQVEYEGVLRSCERPAEDNPYSDRPFLVDGFWWLGICDAPRVLRDGEAVVHFLYPPEPTVLHQQWPEVFPDAVFWVMLGEEKKIQKADLCWLADAPGLDTRVAPPVRPRRSTPATEVATLTYNILNGRDGQPPSADAAFNYLLRGEYRSAQRGDEKELAEWIVSTDADKGTVQIIEGGELTRDPFKRTFGALTDDKTR